MEGLCATLDFMHKNFSDYFTLLLRAMSERANIGAALESSEAYLVLAVSRPPRLGAPRGPGRKGRFRPATGGTVRSRRPVAPSGTSGGRRRGRGAAASCGGETPGVPSVPPRKVGGLSRRRSLRGWPSGREKGVVRWLLIVPVGRRARGWVQGLGTAAQVWVEPILRQGCVSAGAQVRLGGWSGRPFAFDAGSRAGSRGVRSARPGHVVRLVCAPDASLI